MRKKAQLPAALGSSGLAAVILLASFAAPTPTHGAQSLVLSIVRLRADVSANADTGALYARALVDDNSTNGLLEVGLLAGTVNVIVEDSAQFSHSFTLTGCKKKGTGKISCKSADRRVKARFQPKPQGPLLYIMRVNVRRLGEAQAGSEQPAGPVSVLLSQPGVTRADIINDCSGRGGSRLICREN
jgi:hypothetical protein